MTRLDSKMSINAANADPLQPPPSISSDIFNAEITAWIQSGKTLSLAESCTGGLLSAKICSRPGVSSAFLGSVVTYSNQMKMSLLGVLPETLESFGAVSRECAVEMVEGIQRISNSDIAVALTGIAGPSGGTLDKPVGTVWIAVKFGKEEAIANCYFFEKMNRIEIQTSACRAALHLINQV